MLVQNREQRTPSRHLAISPSRHLAISIQSNVNKWDDKSLRPSHSHSNTPRDFPAWCDVIVTIYKPRWESWHWIRGREGGRVTHNDDNDVFSHQEVAPGQGLNICQNNPRCLDQQSSAPPLLSFSYPSCQPLILAGFYSVFIKPQCRPRLQCWPAMAVFWSRTGRAVRNLTATSHRIVFYKLISGQGEAETINTVIVFLTSPTLCRTGLESLSRWWRKYQVISDTGDVQFDIIWTP